MVHTVTSDTLASFIIKLGQRLVENKEVLVDFIDDKDLYINSQEYLSDKGDIVYDMSDPAQYNNFFTSLKTGA